MKFKIYKIPLENPNHTIDEMNAFCAQHAIESIEKHFVANGDNSFWTFCIKWTDNSAQPSLGGNTKKASSSKAKIDYKTYFDNPNDFALYDEIRILRNSLAEAGDFPPYSIFNNAQLAEIVEQKITTKTEFKQMEGVGKVKTEKYADVFIEKINEVNQRLGLHGANPFS